MRPVRPGRVAALSAALLVSVPLAGPVAPVAGATGLAGFAAETLTAGPERYVVRTGPAGALTVRAEEPTPSRPPQDWNRREVLVGAGATASSDQSVCATWSDESRPLDQEGLAVRLRGGPAGGTRAITLTKNTFARYVWVFNLLAWDTGRAGLPWQSLGQFDLSQVLAPHLKLLPFPWRVCLRAVGRRVDLKVWLPAREPEPAWSDPVHTRSTRVPGGLGGPGVPGWYVGHLRSGDHVTFEDLAVADLTAPGLRSPRGRRAAAPRP